MNFARTICLVAVVAMSVGPAWASKPRPPVRLTMKLTNEPKPGEKANVQISVHSKLDIEKLSLRCRIPRGLKLDKDQKSQWELSVKKNAPSTVAFKVPIPDGRRYKLIARASAQTDKGPIGAIAKLVIALGDPQKTKTRPNILETKDGEKLRLNPE